MDCFVARAPRNDADAASVTTISFRPDLASTSYETRSVMNPEPIFDLAHLGHMELLTPKPDESLKFFVDVMGMTISGRKGESVYLRGWDDYERYSLKLTASKTSGMEHIALRARSPQPLERRIPALKGSGCEIGLTHRPT